MINTGGPVFANSLGGGMHLREWFATFAPQPTPEEITNEMERDKMKNPHGDTYKPQRRSRLEIIADLRYGYADAMIARGKR